MVPGDFVAAIGLIPLWSSSGFGSDPGKRPTMDVVEGGQGYQLREAAADYKPLFEDENEDIGLENVYDWDLNAE